MDLLGIRGSVPPRPWRVVRGLISCFLSSPLSLSLSRDQNGTVLFVGQRRREGRKEEEAGLPLPYTYSDCRFKCLLITKLVPQPPRSRPLCIFISTSYGRFQEEERRRRFIFIRRPTVSPRMASFWRVLFLQHAPEISRQPA